MSFVKSKDEKPWSAAIRRSIASSRWLIAIPLVLMSAMYARFFYGFWLGDDFGFLHQAWLASADGNLWVQTWAQFFAVASDGVVFYRPMMIASVALNEWIAGDNFAGWFALNYLAHAGNTVIIAMLIARLAAACERDGRVAGVIAATFFALCPVLAEGVFWVAARADAYVTLLTLAGVYVWTSSPTPAMRAAALPVLFGLALGFKESAAVFPLQMMLVALAWPGRLSRAQIVAVAACFFLVALFLGLRAHFFGDFWRVYMRPDTAPRVDALWLGTGSIEDWWKSLTQRTPRGAIVYLGILGSACVLIASQARGAQRRIAAALLCASGGVVLATLLATGGMPASGEGGRLAYTPVAWLALAIGVAGSEPASDIGPGEGHPWYRRAGLALFACATFAGTWVLQGELRAARSAQNQVRDLVNASREWAVTHAGLTLLMIEQNYGPIVTTRNAQAWLVLPPIQPTPLLQRVLPTLPAELSPRHDQLLAGLATRLDKVRPSRLDGDELGRLFEHDAAHWPEHYACWSRHKHRFVELAAPDPSDRTRWVAALLDGFGQCTSAG
jgi:hypothetical protein